MHRFRMVAILSVTILTLGLTFGISPVRAGEFGTKEEAQALVEKAVAFWTANGRDMAIAAFNDRLGQFVDRDLYIVAATLADGVRIAHGFNAKMIGKSLNELRVCAARSRRGSSVERTRGIWHPRRAHKSLWNFHLMAVPGPWRRSVARRPLALGNALNAGSVRIPAHLPA